MKKKRFDIFTFPVLLMLFIPFFKPSIIGNYTYINMLFYAWKFVSITIMIYNICKSLRFDKNDFYLIGLFVFLGIYLLNNIMYRNNIFDMLNIFASISTLVLFVRYLILNQYADLFLKVLVTICVVICVLQYLSIFIVNIRSFLDSNFKGDFIYFLGPDNYSAFIMIPLISIILFFDIKKSNDEISKYGWIILVLFVLTNVFLKSVTASFAGVVFILLVFIHKKYPNFLTNISLKRIMVVFVCLLILILFFNIQNLFSKILEEYLGKGITLNSRTIIWDFSISLIKENFLFGHGDFSEYDLFNNYLLYGTTHAHNMLLDLMLRTGLCGTMAYFYFLFNTIEIKLVKMLKTPAYVLYIGFISFVILSFMDFYINIPIFYCFIILIRYYEKFFIDSNL